MTPPADALLASPQAAVDLGGAVLRAVLAVGALVAFAVAWFVWQRRQRGPVRQLEVLDRAVLARGASVALLRVGARRLLVGVSAEGVRLIRDLDEAGGAGGAHDPRAGAGAGAGAMRERFASCLTQALGEDRR